MASTVQHRSTLQLISQHNTTRLLRLLLPYLTLQFTAASLQHVK